MRSIRFTHDNAAVARALSQIADQPADLADAFFERREEIELPPEDEALGIRVWRESGFAIRLVRGEQAWLAARDRLSSEDFLDALRRVARAMPRSPYPRQSLIDESWSEPPRATELLAFPAAVQREIRAHKLTFPVKLTVRRHRRWVQVIGTQLAAAEESESFYSIVAAMPWGRYGVLIHDLERPAVAEQLALALVRSYRAHQAPPPDTGRQVVVLGPAATAVLLHEAVAHALEADTLALGGHPEAAIGVRLGSELLNVLDDPTSAPEGVRRTTDDEGLPVFRRFLIREGVVEQPLADRLWARHSDVLAAGAGRRSNRQLPPGPRSSHLELIPGELSSQELMADADGGLFLPEAERGHLDPLSGRFFIRFPYGRRIHHQVPGPPVGGCSIEGHVSDLLAAVTGIGREVRVAGAGWCAKGGMKLPVWATTPELRLEGLEIKS